MLAELMERAPLRVGLLGAAGIAPAAMINPARRRNDVELVAVASRRRAGEFAERHRIPTAYSHYEELLADDSIGLVYIALPPSEHARWTIAALEAGKDVLCEKPMAMNAAEAEKVLAATQSTGKRAFEAFHDYYHPLQAWVRDFLESGALGSPVSVKATFNGANPFDPTSIRHVPELGGGALMDLGCYPVHWVRTLFGEPRIAHATAERNRLGVDVWIEALAEFDGGVHGVVSASMKPDATLESSLTVIGEAGSLRVDNLVFPARGHSIQIERDGVTHISTVAGLDTYDHQLAAVIDGLRSGKPLATEGPDYLGNMAAIDAIYAAAGIR
ncbi:Gfo/Idh/MocA family protein [Sinomonas terrae]|uniref:Gfo/Idh/MocA family oxidoreductase n=1 Tax=Sinomonas terrae TaxID=2908838 RepID=A0ABS9TVY2_9MICC|nr:Gfo/Idh/MocA family oxidoreductase [Sinomonas terrae]MCH6468548.1 Gfo/Idh/MocA family oxidoreductase [Sinomonas terrae]